MAKPNAFDIPRLFYFISKNVFTGSRGNFNFKIVPEDGLQVSIWHGMINSELAEMEASASFALSEEGFAEMLQWLEAEYQK